MSKKKKKKQVTYQDYKVNNGSYQTFKDYNTGGGQRTDKKKKLSEMTFDDYEAEQAAQETRRSPFATGGGMTGAASFARGNRTTVEMPQATDYSGTNASMADLFAANRSMLPVTEQDRQTVQEMNRARVAQGMAGGLTGFARDSRRDSNFRGAGSDSAALGMNQFAQGTRARNLMRRGQETSMAGGADLFARGNRERKTGAADSWDRFVMGMQQGTPAQASIDMEPYKEQIAGGQKRMYADTLRAREQQRLADSRRGINDYLQQVSGQGKFGDGLKDFRQYIDSRQQQKRAPGISERLDEMEGSRKQNTAEDFGAWVRQQRFPVEYSLDIDPYKEAVAENQKLMYGNLVRARETARRAELKQSPLEKYNALAAEDRSNWMDWGGNKDAMQDLMSYESALEYNTNNPYSLTRLQGQRDEYLRKKEEASERARQEQLAMDQRAGLTPEELAQAQQQVVQLEELQGKCRMLDEEGLHTQYWDGDQRRYIPVDTDRRPDDYDDQREVYDQVLYDYLYGEGAYEQMLEDDSISGEQMDIRLTMLWDMLEYKSMQRWIWTTGGMQKQKDELLKDTQGYSAELEAANREIRYYQDRIDEIDAQIKFQTPYFELMEKQPEVTMGEYIPENDRGAEWAEWTPEYLDPALANGFINVHDVYSMVNRGKGYAKIGSQRVTDYNGYALMMNPDEILQFNDYYNHGQYEEAEAFLEALKPFLRDRYSQYEQIDTSEVAHMLPISSSVASVGMQVGNGFVAVPRLLAGWFGDKEAADPNSDWYRMARDAGVIQETVGNDVGPFKKLYLVGMNTLRNVANGLLTMGVGDAQEVVGLGMFALQIYQESTYKYLEETGDYNAANWMAILDAAIETATEKLPFDAMIAGAKINTGHPLLDAAIIWFENSLAEGAEEFAGSTAGEKIKGLVTGRDSLQKRADEIFMEGGYFKDGKWIEIDKEDTAEAIRQADAQALREWRDEIVESTIAGFSGGGLGGLYSLAGRYTQMNKTGRTVSEYMQRQQQEQQESGAPATGNQLIELGLGMKEGTGSNKMATRLNAMMEKGKQPNNYQLGELWHQIAQDVGEQQEGVIADVVNRHIRDQLLERGLSEGNAEKFAEIIGKTIIEGRNLTRAESRTLAQSMEAVDLWQTYNSSTIAAMQTRAQLAQDVVEGTQNEQSVMNVLGEMTAKPAQSAVYEEVQTAVEKTRNSADALDYMAEHSGNLMTEDFAEKAKEILESDEQAAKSKTFVEDAMKIRMAVMTLSDVMPKTNMSEESAQALRTAAQEEFDANEELRIQRDDAAITPGKGTSSFDGAEYGTEEWREKLKGFSKETRNQIGAVAEIARVMGHRVEFINDENRTFVNGWQQAQDGSIVINIASTEWKDHSMLATLPHELTHWLEHNSRQGYAQLRKFVVDSLRQQGVDVERMTMNTIRNQERVRMMEEDANNGQSTITSLDLNDAMAELVAKSCENLLTSEEMKNRLQEQNSGLFETIKQGVKNIIARIDAAIRGIDSSMSAEARLLQNQREKLAKLWLEAHEEATSGESNETALKTGMVQYSVENMEGETDNKTDIERYKNEVMKRDRAYFENILKKNPDVGVAIISDPISVPKTSDGKIDTQKVLENARNNKYMEKTPAGTKMGQRSYAFVPDLGINVEMTGKGLRHGFSKNKNELFNNTENAMIAQYAAQILQGAVEVNRGNAHPDTAQVEHVLVAGARFNIGNETKDYAVRFVIQNNNDKQAELVSMDIIGKLNAINEKQTALSGLKGDESLSAHAMSAKERLSDFFEDVKNDMNDTFAEKVYAEKGIEREDNDFSRNLMYSVEQSPDMDVTRFMEGLSEFHMNSEQEKVMLRQFRNLKGDMEAIRFKLDDRRKRIAALEAKENPSVYEREQLRKFRNIQQNDETRLARMQKEMIRITSDKGYAKLMYDNTKLMTDLVSGRTAVEMRKTISAMNSELDSVSTEMAERAERLKELAEKEGVLRIRQQFNKKGLQNIAERLKKSTGSQIETDAVENRLALIALKMKQGQFDMENTQELADTIVGRITQKYDSDVLDMLRGSTITLSKSMLKELKGQGKTLKDIRAELAGTGIRISDRGGVALDAKWEELCDMIPTLDRESTDKDMLDGILGVIRSEKQNSARTYGSEEDMMAVTEQVLEAARDLLPEIVTDEKSLKLIRETLEFVQQMSGEAKSAAEAMDEINSMMKRLQKTGTAAALTANTLSGNVQDAISYFNDLAEQSEAAMWKRQRLQLIDQLKSENTMNILKEQEKWKARIEKDKTVRSMMQSNMQLRKQIHTNFARIRKMIVNETDQKNVQEHMKSLARHMLSLITQNDLMNGRKITGFDAYDLAETQRVLNIMTMQDGEFSIDDLQMIHDEEAQAAVADALADLEDGIGFYNATPGKDVIANLQAFRNSLTRIRDAVTTITNIINAENSLAFMDRRMDVAEGAEMIAHDFGRSHFKGDLIGKRANAVNAVKRSVIYGNTTPVYYFKNLKNRGMDMMWKDMTQGENRNGLETQAAQDYVHTLAEKTHYKEWADEMHEVTLGGQKVKMSINNMMELYAIWRREQTLNPEMSQHLRKGGIFIDNAQERAEGRLRHDRTEQKSIRVTDIDIQGIGEMMTQEQRDYMNGIVSYLSNEMSQLGNEASMRMYGIKKYKESYYFPMKVWDGVKSARSDKGITGTTENRAANKSWSKRRINMASNALVIGDFTQDAVNHIVEMINYNTMAPAIENMNKVLNWQFTEGQTEEDMTKRNLRVMFKQNYGTEALKYLKDLMKDLNGGVTQDNRKTLWDKALTIFKKNAVAGSLSVALQQPLSYIRAAMMISPKYLAKAISPEYWKGSYEEMTKHSGVSVLKDMGRFDMNFGQSAKEYITPETKKSALSRMSDLLTELPQQMDRMTWTRMWSAVKLEQHELHPEMDMKSDAFLDMVGERFNEVIRDTQVYDSVLTKSSNMRSKSYTMKTLTSFMAEPTLTINVLADAVNDARRGEKGSKEKLAKAGATYVLSAAAQAFIKAMMGSGRSPDEKKTWLENFMYKFQTAVMNEINPLNLIPGYSDIVETLKKGELADDAMGALGKMKSIVDTGREWIEGKRGDTYRNLEDTVGQLVQLFTNVPAKNIMRDLRAAYNWFTGDKYAKRDTSAAVLRYQAQDAWFAGDNMLGLVNSWLGDAGYEAKNTAYYQRIYNAMKNGDQSGAEGMTEYLTMAKGVKGSSIESGVKKAAKEDESMSAADRSSWMIENGMMTKLNDIGEQYKKGDLTAEEAGDLMRQMDPEITDDEVFWKLDAIDYQKEKGGNRPTGYWYRMNDAVNANKAEDIQTAVDMLLAHGVEPKDIKKHLSGWKSEYLAADLDGKRRIRDALTKAYKAAGYTVDDANKTIENWTKEKK